MLIITGTYPPRRCGVGDYCYNLIRTQTARESGWQVYTTDCWNISNIRQITNEISKINFDIANLQYPTMGYGTSITPHLLAIYIKYILRKPIITTIHEYSRLGWKGRLAAKIFFRCSRHTIFTTEVERQFAIKNNGYLNKKSSIVKIFSNIDQADEIKPVAERTKDIGYFGYIRPDKGIETFIDVCEQISAQNKECRMYIMGQTQEEFRWFYEPIIKRIEKCNIELILNRSAKEVANILSDTKIAYLPYPDGLTERRGSFLAALLNKCLIVSTIGTFTTEKMKQAFTLCENEKAPEVLNNILKDIENNGEQQRVLTENIEHYIENQIPQSWESVALQYKQIITEI